MSTQVQLRRGTAAQTAAFTGAIAGLTYNTDDKLLHIHDGVTPGGNPVKPGGSPTGDLTGSYPNPTVSKAGGLGIVRVQTQPGTSQSVTNTTSATVLSTINFGALPSNGSINARFQTVPNGSGAKTYFVYLNGIQILTAGINPTVSCLIEVDVFNQNAQNAQLNEARLFSNSGSATRVTGSSAIDLSGSANTLTFAIQLATSTDSCAVNNVRAKYITP